MEDNWSWAKTVALVGSVWAISWAWVKVMFHESQAKKKQKPQD